MNSNVFSLFDKTEIQKIGNKLYKTLLNNEKQGKSKFTQFAILPCNFNSSTNHDLIDIYNIFIDEEKWIELMSRFINLDKKIVNSTNFEYKNMKLIRFNDDSGKSVCEKHISHEQIIGNNYLHLLLEINEVDVSQFSCRDDIRQGDVTEHRFLVSDKAPIYLSFIHDKSVNKYYYKLWFHIKEDIDDVLDSFLE